MFHNLKEIKKTVMVRALVCAFGASLLSVGLAPCAHAQSNATATIFGQVASPAGSTVVLENLATGTHRTLTPDAHGKYQATSMPPGRYKVQLMQGAAVVGTKDVEALIGSGVEVSFDATGEGNGQTVTVAGRRQTIDVSNTNNGSVFTAKQLAELPIATSIRAIMQLAPGAARGDSRLGGESFGGSGVSENSYYINGFPVTNIYGQIGGTTLPYFAVAQAQILSGGYSAEFGRSTGGIVNITTKSGTNTWEVGGTAQWIPNGLRDKARNSYYPNTGANPSTDGKLYQYRQQNTYNEGFVSVFAGGPLIKDKLFIFANAEQDRNFSEYVGANTDSGTAGKNGWTESQTLVPRYMVKLDYNITDNHHLEFTQIHDANRTDWSYYGYDFKTFTSNHVQAGGGFDSASTDDSILKYTGYLTDNLTVTALRGQFKSLYPTYKTGLIVGQYQINAPLTNRAPGVSYSSNQLAQGSLQVPDANDAQTTSRLDLEYKLGSHSLRLGVDHNKTSSINGSADAGGGVWNYRFQKDPNAPLPRGISPAAGGGLGKLGYYVTEDHNDNSAQPHSTQSAQYIQDRYQVTPNLILDLGLRNEQFNNMTSHGETYVSQNHQLAPRLGAAWDVNGDGSMKAFVNAGRYQLPLPTRLVLNLAGNPISTSHAYTYTGTDPLTGYPTGLVELSPNYSAGGSYGQTVDLRQSAATNLGAMYQDDLAFGFEKAWSHNLTVGAKFTYRNLGSTIEDWCDQRPIDAWAKRNNVKTNNFSFNCALINPGQDATLRLDLKGDGSVIDVPLTAAEIGLPKVKRTYVALDTFIEHPLRDGWYGKLAYTLSRSSGNTEGQVASDFNASNVATTSMFDNPELMVGADGLLPNNHTHAIKAFGYYQIDAQWTAGANLAITTGSPKECTSNQLPGAYDVGYGSLFFYCGGKLSPRGSFGNLPTDVRLALSTNYKPLLVPGLELRAEVFNVLNRQTQLNEDSTSQQGSIDNPTTSPYYQFIKSRSPERSFKFSVTYKHQF